MTFVSMRLPEEIPWFKASRRAVVAAMSKEIRTGDVHHALKNAPKRACMIYGYPGPRHLGLPVGAAWCFLESVAAGLCQARAGNAVRWREEADPVQSSNSREKHILRSMSIIQRSIDDDTGPIHVYCLCDHYSNLLLQLWHEEYSPLLS